jgi:hypothetical protein
MSSPIRYAIVAVFALCCAVFSPAAQSQNTTKKTPSANVSGRITLHGKGIAGIAVSLRLSNVPRPTPEFKGVTDPEGNYRITGIAPGSYTVYPMAPAYVFLDGSGRGQAKSLLLSEGEDVQGIDFSLERGGVITGKVTDAEGRPVIEERLTLMPADQNQPNEQPMNFFGVNGAQTDDRGVYRIYGLVPGQYKIFVGRDENGYYPGGGVARIAYKKTFFPNVTELAEAKVLDVTEGSELTNVDITLGQSLPGFNVSGRVVDRTTDKAIPGLRFGLRRVLNSDYTGINSSAPSNSQGDFRLENVTPGKYEILILPVQGVETRSDPLAFEVVDQDVNGLIVKAFTGLSISGKIVIEGKHDQTAYAKLAELRLHVYVRTEGVAPTFGQTSIINTDGSFRLGGLTSGVANFSLNSTDGRMPVNFSIMRVERDGVAQPRGLQINADEQQVTGVKIVLKYGTGSVRGEIKFENGPLPSGSRLMVWLRKTEEPDSGFRPYSADLRGHFLIEGVSAGDYELNVQANAPGRPVANAKQSVTVTEGSVTDVVVSLELKPNPEPTPNP